MQLSINQSIIRWSSALLRCCAAVSALRWWWWVGGRPGVHCARALRSSTPGLDCIAKARPHPQSPRPVPFTVHCSFTARSLHSSVRSFVRSFIRSFIPLFVRSFILFLRSFIAGFRSFLLHAAFFFVWVLFVVDCDELMLRSFLPSFLSFLPLLLCVCTACS